MLFFSHLVLGIIAGIIIAFIVNDNKVIIYTAAGSVFPDLIDKPLGYLLLSESIGSGRIFFHGFWLMFFLLIAGIVIFIKIKNPLLLALSLGITVHQLADNMWNSPVSWFWPIFGPYAPGNASPDYFFKLILKEFSTISEIFSLCINAIFLGVYFLWKKYYVQK
ncbi:MAG: metal-dependent hydrolase [Methanomicrobium sp.]|nr:metal-dependent hydrolase [Methanomicrobium sp.]